MILILHLSTIERHSMYGLNMHIQKVASILNMQDLTIYLKEKQVKDNTKKIHMIMRKILLK